MKSYPAPVGGWNARDSLAAMKPIDAVALENWFPGASYVEIRGGYSNHATGMSGNGKTLAVYNAMNGTNTMWASTAAGVYDVSSAGAVGASVAARTSGKHQWLNFGDGTNQWLIMVNGADKPLYYDGSSWTAVDGASTPALTGITTTELVNVFASKGRLFFLANNSLSFWYLAAGAAGGALTEFDLSAVAKKGGYLMAGETWTVDAGDGPDDRVVFITSEGEVIVYQGTNPGSANSWSLVGVYEVGNPLGRRCMKKYGGDLVILTQNGAFPMAAAMQSASIDYKLALSFKIENAFNSAARINGNTFGWTIAMYPARSAMIVNVPLSEDGEHEQYVMNTITKAWCKFKEWDAEDFAVFNEELYFTTGNKVVKAWTGQIDGENDIIAYGKTAFSYFNGISQKQFKLFRPVLAVNGVLTFLTDIDVDFQDTPINGTATYSVISGALWDVDDWDEGYWAAGLEVVKAWTSPNEYQGLCASGKIKVATNSLSVQWMACDYVYEAGGIL
jgi:hypothetical protein